MRAGRAALIITISATLAGAVSAAEGVDPQIGSITPRPGLQDAQNEPDIAVDQGTVARKDLPGLALLAVGANDYWDEAPCTGANCAFADGVGISGVYFSKDDGASWTGRQAYPGGLTAHAGTVKAGVIATVPRYARSLAAHGDPSLAFGPTPTPLGGFSWAGSRLYYANLAQRSKAPEKGPQTIAVSRTDDVAGASTSAATAWMPPVIVSRPATGDVFADKPALWADNAASSAYFGSVYVCWASYRSEADVELSGGSARPILFSASTDGGTVWSAPVGLPTGQVPFGSTRQGCALRTDSRGTVYVVWEDAPPSGSTGPNAMYLTRSFDGGATFEPARRVATVVDVGEIDPVQGRRTIDGFAGARTNSYPSMDIANGAPLGDIVDLATNQRVAAAPNTIVLAWDDGRAGLNNEQVLVTYSIDGGLKWSDSVNAASVARRAAFPKAPIDRPDLPAVAISPNGSSLYVVYTAFHVQWQTSTSAPRPAHAVMRTVDFQDFRARGTTAAWTELLGATGDARGSSAAGGEERAGAAGLAIEFIGDYNSIVATDRAGYAAWIDLGGVGVCPAVNSFRQSRIKTNALPPRSLLKSCPMTFGNTNLFGGVLAPRRG
jgi:hypothetical protein